MMTKTASFLVLVPDEIKDPSGAMRYAAKAARESGGRVALLAVVEPEEIGTWGGVDKVMTDDAFARARKVVAHFAPFIQESSGADPINIFVKGGRREALLETIDKEPDIAALVLTADAKENGQNVLIQYLTSDKGIKKLTIPLIVVPESEDRGRKTDDRNQAIFSSPLEGEDSKS